VKNSHMYFRNSDCKYFPCHPQPNESEFNCLFCYCPLYAMGDRCGGDFTYDATGVVKDCISCHKPHIPMNYDVIVDTLIEEKLEAYKRLQK